MAATKSYHITLSAEFATRVLQHKPRWLTMTDDDFLSTVIAAGNCDEYLAKVAQAGEQVKKIQSSADAEVAKINAALGLKKSILSTSKPGPKKGAKPSTSPTASPEPQSKAA